MYLHGQISPQKYTCHDLWSTSVSTQGYTEFCCCLVPKFRLHKWSMRCQTSRPNSYFAFPPLPTDGTVLPCLCACLDGCAEPSVRAAVPPRPPETHRGRWQRGCDRPRRCRQEAFPFLSPQHSCSFKDCTSVELSVLVNKSRPLL